MKFIQKCIKNVKINKGLTKPLSHDIIKKKQEVMDMKFAIKFVDSCIVELIDLDSAEILAEGPEDVQKWFKAYEGNYTLTIL